MISKHMRMLLAASLVAAAAACSKETTAESDVGEDAESDYVQMGSDLTPPPCNPGTPGNTEICSWTGAAPQVGGVGVRIALGPNVRREAAQVLLPPAAASLGMVPDKLSVKLRRLTQVESGKFNFVVEIRKVTTTGGVDTLDPRIGAGSLTLLKKSMDVSAISESDSDYLFDFDNNEVDLRNGKFAFVMRIEPTDTNAAPVLSNIVIGAAVHGDNTYLAGAPQTRKIRRNSTGVFPTDVPFRPGTRDVAFGFIVGEPGGGLYLTVPAKVPAAGSDKVSPIVQPKIQFGATVKDSDVIEGMVESQVSTSGTKTTVTKPKNFQFSGLPADTLVTLEYDTATKEAVFKFDKMIPYTTDVVVTVAGGMGGIKSITGKKLQPRKADGSEPALGENFVDHVWPFKVRPQDELNPWQGTMSSGAGWAQGTGSVNGASVTYKLFSVTGEPAPVGYAEAANGSMKLNAGFIGSTTRPSNP